MTSSISKGTILIVDDDADIRDVTVEVLASEGYEVAVAENGRDALDRLLDGVRPDVILLDLMMPVMDGWAFREAQRNEPRIASIPVVVFTAHTTRGLDLDRLHADAFLTKPIALSDLLWAIERVRRASSTKPSTTHRARGSEPGDRPATDSGAKMHGQHGKKET